MYFESHDMLKKFRQDLAQFWEMTEMLRYLKQPEMKPKDFKKISDEFQTLEKSIVLFENL